MHAYRTHTCGALRAADTGQTVRLSGWIHRKRDHGGLLFIASAPSLGYQTAYLSSASAPANPATVTQETSTVTLSNGLVTAVLQPNGNGVWGLVSVVDVTSDVELIADGEGANDLQFWADGGDEYEFGNELVPNAWQLVDVTSSLSAPTIAVIESGPVRVTVRTTVTWETPRRRASWKTVSPAVDLPHRRG